MGQTHTVSPPETAVIYGDVSPLPPCLQLAESAPGQLAARLVRPTIYSRWLCRGLELLDSGSKAYREMLQHCGWYLTMLRYKRLYRKG